MAVYFYITSEDFKRELGSQLIHYVLTVTRLWGPSRLGGKREIPCVDPPTPIGGQLECPLLGVGTFQLFCAPLSTPLLYFEDSVRSLGWPPIPYTDMDDSESQFSTACVLGLHTQLMQCWGLDQVHHPCQRSIPTELRPQSLGTLSERAAYVIVTKELENNLREALIYFGSHFQRLVSSVVLGRMWQSRRANSVVAGKQREEDGDSTCPSWLSPSFPQAQEWGHPPSGWVYPLNSLENIPTNTPESELC